MPRFFKGDTGKFGLIKECAALALVGSLAVIYLAKDKRMKVAGCFGLVSAVGLAMAYAVSDAGNVLLSEEHNSTEAFSP